MYLEAPIGHAKSTFIGPLTRIEDDFLYNVYTAIETRTEDKAVAQKIADIVAERDQNKPIQGNIKADIANNTQSIFEGRLTRLKQEFALPNDFSNFVATL